MPTEQNSTVAYICNGLNPKCSGRGFCFKKLGPIFDEEMTCSHTFETKYAVNDICENPEDFVPERFERFVDGDVIKYFEVGRAGSQ